MANWAQISLKHLLNIKSIMFFTCTSRSRVRNLKSFSRSVSHSWTQLSGKQISSKMVAERIISSCASRRLESSKTSWMTLDLESRLDDDFYGYSFWFESSHLNSHVPCQICHSMVSLSTPFLPHIWDLCWIPFSRESSLHRINDTMNLKWKPTSTFSAHFMIANN